MFSGICTKPLVRAAALIPALLVFAIGIDAGHSTPLSDNDEVRESVVRVEVDKGKVVMQGTGFILNDRGYVATNHHVIENAKTIFLISCRRQADRRAGSGRRRTETTPAMASSNFDDVKGKRDRWTGTRSVQMTIDNNTEPLSFELTTSGSDLLAGIKHEESDDTRGWLKELLGKLTVGGFVSFQEAPIALDETFSLNGSSDALEPCLKAKYAKVQGQEQQQAQ